MEAHVYDEALQFRHPKTRKVIRRGIMKLRCSPGAVEKSQRDLNILLKARFERIEEAPANLHELAYEAYFSPIYEEKWPEIWKRFTEKNPYRERLFVFKFSPLERIRQLEEELCRAYEQITELKEQFSSRGRRRKSARQQRKSSKSEALLPKLSYGEEKQSVNTRPTDRYTGPSKHKKFNS